MLPLLLAQGGRQQDSPSGEVPRRREISLCRGMRPRPHSLQQPLPPPTSMAPASRSVLPATFSRTTVRAPLVAPLTRRQPAPPTPSPGRRTTASSLPPPLHHSGQRLVYSHPPPPKSHTPPRPPFLPQQRAPPTFAQIGEV